jgi:hypothetical protein
LTNRPAIAVLAAFGIAALAATASAGDRVSAAITSAKLAVNSATPSLGGPGYRIRLTKSQGDSDVARVVVYVPAGSQLVTGQPFGTKLGTTAATVLTRQPNAVVPGTGTVEVANPAAFAAQATACTGTAAHTQTWALRFQAGGTALTVPAFVDTPTAPPLSTVAAATITFCLPPGSTQAGSQTRSARSVSMLTTEFTTTSIVSPSAAGEYRWRALVTPFDAGTGRIDDSSAVEVQSLVELPAQVTLRAKVSRPSRGGFANVVYSGVFRVTGKGVGSGAVDIYTGTTQQGAKKLKSQSTADNGSFTGTIAVKEGTARSALFLLARARSGDQDLGSAGCRATFVPPVSQAAVPCVDATAPGISVASTAVRVMIPKAPKPGKR